MADDDSDLAAEKNLPFPHKEEFRKARRNSLLWSALTIATGFGTQPALHGDVTMPYAGFNLGYDLTMIVTMALCVAVFMLVGFIREYQIVRLSVSELFAGSSDVEEAFERLSNAAGAAAGDIEQIEARAREMLEMAQHVANTTMDTSTLLALRDMAEPAPKIMAVEKIIKSNTPNSDVQLSSLPVAQAVRDDIDKIEHWAREVSKRATAMMDYLVPPMRELENRLKDHYEEFTTSERNRIEGHFKKLEADISNLTRFHRGIHSRDRRWFFLWDVLPVFILFVQAVGMWSLVLIR